MAFSATSSTNMSLFSLTRTAGIAHQSALDSVQIQCQSASCKKVDHLPAKVQCSNGIGKSEKKLKRDVRNLSSEQRALKRDNLASFRKHLRASKQRFRNERRLKCTAVIDGVGTFGQQFALSEAQIEQTHQATRPYLESVLSNPDRRPDCTPYLLLHPAGKQVRGTVLMFHGFTGTPKQMSVLSRYLFHAGFNIYNPSLEGQCFSDTDNYWPKVDLRAEYYDPVARAASEDPALRKFFAALGAVGASEEPSETPNLLEMTLSVGGTVALALATTHPSRVSAVVAFAPLLRIHGAVRAQYVNLVGPLHLRETGYDPSLKFSVGCYTANQRFGRTVASQKSVDVLSDVPTLLVLTENEDAADVAENEQLSMRLADKEHVPHVVLKYGEEFKVPHPMVDPQEESQGMRNAYWKTMYQETLRFLLEGKVDVENFQSAEPCGDLPQPSEPEAVAANQELPAELKQKQSKSFLPALALIIAVLALIIFQREKVFALLGNVLKR